MNWLLLVPVLWPMAAAVLCWLVGRHHAAARNRLARWAGLAELAAVLAIAVAAPALTLRLPGLCGLGLSWTLDGFRRIYAVVCAVLWAGTLCFSEEYFAHYHRRNRYYFFNLMTLGAAMGVFLSADLGTTFVFFEVMSFTSYAWVAHDETASALRAAETYLAVAVIGGMTALMGLFLLWHELGTLEIAALRAAAEGANRAVLYAASGCLLAGFGAKAGMFPLHIWLPKAHPVAPAPASALLSGLLTKTGVFGVLIVCAQILPGDHAWGLLVLMLGTVTMLLGAVEALFSTDLKRTLACSSMSQIGFILVGAGSMCLLGEENALAARGTLLHMVNHSLFKLVLFLCAGVVYQNLHQLNLNDIRGFGRRKPLLHFCFLMGALGIGGIPLWSGYISKTLLHEGLLELGGAYRIVEWIFLLSGGLTLAYMTRLYVCLFWQRHPTRQKEFDAMGQGMGWRSGLTLALCALAIPVLGTSGAMDAIANLGAGFLTGAVAEPVRYFAWANLRGALISVVLGAAVYLLPGRTWLQKKGCYPDRWPAWLDLEDRVYRPVIHGFYLGFGWLRRLMGENVVTGRLARGIVTAAAAASRLVLNAPDALAALLGRTVFAPSPLRPDSHVARSPAWRAGSWLDRQNARRGRKTALGTLFYRGYHTFHDTTRRITGSLSFALMMACAGICLLVFYLLYHFA